MELVFAILAALIVWRWFETGEIWLALAAFATIPILLYLGLLVISVVPPVAWAVLFWTAYIGGCLAFYGFLIAAAIRLARRLRQTRRP